MSSVSEIISMQKSLLDMEAVDVMGVRMVPFDKVLSIFDQILSASSSSDLDNLLNDDVISIGGLSTPPIEEDTIELDVVSSTGKWLGSVGSTVLLDLEYVDRSGPKQGNYGDYYIYNFMYQGNRVTWITGINKSLIKGNIYKTMCEIKEHSEFNGERFTKISRCVFQ